jgi:hypothetical protein
LLESKGTLRLYSFSPESASPLPKPAWKGVGRRNHTESNLAHRQGGRRERRN